MKNMKVIVIVGVIIAMVILSSLFQVDQRQQALVLQLGETGAGDS